MRALRIFDWARTIFSPGNEFKGCGESQIFLLRCEQIDVLWDNLNMLSSHAIEEKPHFDLVWVRHDGFQVNNVNERLAQSDVADAAEVKSIHILPD